MNCSAERRGDENRWENSEERGEKRKKNAIQHETGQEFLKQCGHIKEKQKEAERKGDTREKGKKRPYDVKRNRSFKNRSVGG